LSGASASGSVRVHQPTTMTTPTLSLTTHADADRSLPLAYALLRGGAALCFIGHGAFGFLTKAAWLPYFGVVGIPERLAWWLMPVVGAVDVLAGMAVLFAPRVLPLVYMVLWASWTALLRPLAGEPVWETLERAGNYGVPLAMLVLGGAPGPWRDWLALRLRPAPDASARARAQIVLRWTTSALLLGHGALGALTGKALLVRHWEAAGLAGAAPAAGWLEIALAAAVLWRPGAPLLALVAAWKLATEALFPVAGAPLWEFVERGGSYAAPIALVLLSRTSLFTRINLSRSTR
jgi:hypothetical protein